MDRELFEIQEKIKEYANKYNIHEFNIYILPLYNKKSVSIFVR